MSEEDCKLPEIVIDRVKSLEVLNFLSFLSWVEFGKCDKFDGDLLVALTNIDWIERKGCKYKLTERGACYRVAENSRVRSSVMVP